FHEIARLGHPCLVQYVAGPVVAMVRPASARQAVPIVRRMAAVADATTVLLLPSLATALGAPDAAGLGAAALYAVYPPAVAYGSLAYLDPALAPLLVLLLVRLLATARTGAGWVGLGIVTGLLISTKQVGLIALVL